MAEDRDLFANAVPISSIPCNGSCEIGCDCDPPYAARRERYAAVLQPMVHYTADDGHPAMAMRTVEELAAAAVTVADEELKEQAFKTARMLGDKAREMSGEGEADAEYARLRVDLEALWQRWFIESHAALSFRDFVEGIGGELRSVLDSHPATAPAPVSDHCGHRTERHPAHSYTQGSRQVTCPGVTEPETHLGSGVVGELTTHKGPRESCSYPECEDTDA